MEYLIFYFMFAYLKRDTLFFCNVLQVKFPFLLLNFLAQVFDSRFRRSNPCIVITTPKPQLWLVQECLTSAGICDKNTCWNGPSLTGSLVTHYFAFTFHVLQFISNFVMSSSYYSASSFCLVTRSLQSITFVIGKTSAISF